jgi:hypothetical protein
MRFVTLQPSARTDHITDDGHELQQLPYPFHVNEHGEILRQDFWRGDPERVIGFQANLHVMNIDLWWLQVWDKPELAVGKYVVTADSEGNWSTHMIAISSAELHGEPEEVPL